MVAAGWVYGKTGDTITVGDGNTVMADQAGRPYAQPIKRYEETYAVASDVKVFNVNTADYAKSTVADFAVGPGHGQLRLRHDIAPERLSAVRRQLPPGHDTAKVVAIWYFTPQSTTDGKPVWDVPTLSTMLDDKGNDPVSGQPSTRSTRPPRRRRPTPAAPSRSR